jgi:S1-C subfamily serine protease
MFQTVVFLRVTEKIPDRYAPWRTDRSKKSTGSGFAVLVEGPKGNKQKYILTNAHCIQNSGFIECTKAGSSQSFLMSIYDIAPELDLALLKPATSREDESEFWKDLPVVEFVNEKDNQCARGDIVSVIGFPQGGPNPSMTRGIISRYTHIYYNRAVPNIAVQIDAAVNPGNSGGPVFNQKEQIIGVAFAHRANVQNVCYMIPALLVRHYLKEIGTHGHFRGVCDLGIRAEPLENPDMRKYLIPSPDLLPAHTGFLIKDVNPIGASHTILKPEDVLYQIGDHQIDVVGTISLTPVAKQVAKQESDDRVPYWHALRTMSVGSSIKLEFIRDRKKETAIVALKAMPKPLVPLLERDIVKKYYIFGGLAFMTLDIWYLMKASSREDGDGENGFDSQKYNLLKYMDTYPSEGDEEIVILGEVFSSKINIGFRKSNIRLLKINGQEIKNLRQVYTICENAREREYIKFEFENDYIIVLDWNSALEQSETIAKQHTGVSYHNFGTLTLNESKKKKK